MFSLRDDFEEKVQLARYTAMEAGLRHVKTEVLYHLPDQPGLVNIYMQEFEANSFAMSRELAHRADELLVAGEQKILTIDEVRDFAKRIEELSRDMAEHIERIKHTADQFRIPFDEIDPALHSDVIEDVPLLRLRKFLRYWHENIDGPMSEVKVALQRLARDELLHAFNKAASAIENEEWEHDLPAGALIIRPRGHLLN